MKVYFTAYVVPMLLQPMVHGIAGGPHAHHGRILEWDAWYMKYYVKLYEYEYECQAIIQ